MKKRIGRLILSCLIAVTLVVVVSCGPSEAEEGEGVTTPTEEITTPTEEITPPTEEEVVIEEVEEEEPVAVEEVEEEPIAVEVVEEEPMEEEPPTEEEEEPMEEVPPPEEEEEVPEEVPPPEEEEEPPEEIVMVITSTAFQDGETIPIRYTCDGVDISPALSWSGVPEGTQSFVLIVDDPDAPGGTFTHWVIFNIPANTLELEEGIPTSSQLSSGALQGRNDFSRTGYGGPCPPWGSTHHYHFTLYALDITLDLNPGASKTAVLNAMRGHILAQAELIGIYQR